MEPESHRMMRRQGPAMLRGRAIPKTTTDQRHRHPPGECKHWDNLYYHDHHLIYGEFLRFGVEYSGQPERHRFSSIDWFG